MRWHYLMNGTSLRNKEILLSEEDMNGLNKTLEIIAESNISQPFFFVHRDFHSRNLMLLNDNGLGMLDFQDARSRTHYL